MHNFVLRDDSQALEIFDWLQELWPLGDVPEGPSYLIDTRWKVCDLVRRDELIWMLERRAWRKTQAVVQLTDDEPLVMFKLKYGDQIILEY